MKVRDYSLVNHLSAVQRMSDLITLGLQDTHVAILGLSSIAVVQKITVL